MAAQRDAPFAVWKLVAVRLGGAASRLGSAGRPASSRGGGGDRPAVQVQPVQLRRRLVCDQPLRMPWATLAG